MIHVRIEGPILRREDMDQVRAGACELVVHGPSRSNHTPAARTGQFLREETDTVRDHVSVERLRERELNLDIRRRKTHLVVTELILDWLVAAMDDVHYKRRRGQWRVCRRALARAYSTLSPAGPACHGAQQHSLRSRAERWSCLQRRRRLGPSHARWRSHVHRICRCKFARAPRQAWAGESCGAKPRHHQGRDLLTVCCISGEDLFCSHAAW